MRAMILAAGKGERMRPLSLHTPKPLLQVGGKPLLQYHIEALANAGVTSILINTGRHGDQIEARFGRGGRFGVDIEYSHEGEEPLGTGGGVRRVLPWLGDQAFILVNGDVWTDLDYKSLPDQPGGLAHLIMVPNPEHHPGGDFALLDDRVIADGTSLYTYSGIGVYQPHLFRQADTEMFSFVPLLRRAIAADQVSGQLHTGRWFDIGTPERLQALDRELRAR